MIKTKVKEREEPRERVKEYKDITADQKIKALDLALEHIEKQFGKGSIMKLGQDFKL
ncbi:MAG: DNA recombination/repair protein RecA, partial [Candidatus Omnitrophica bacterium]|nr:DNA recombination/repair protein RecA [Candidatus Omnitrophota bacterium]